MICLPDAAPFVWENAIITGEPFPITVTDSYLLPILLPRHYYTALPLQRLRGGGIVKFSNGWVQAIREAMSRVICHFRADPST